MEEVLKYLPHRPPFLLVDRILERDGNRIRARKTVHAEEFWFEGHYPGKPIMPGVLICESVFQTGAILMAMLAGEAPEPTGSTGLAPGERPVAMPPRADAEAELSAAVRRPGHPAPGRSLGGKVPVITRINNVKLKHAVLPGDTMEIEATLKEKVGTAYYLTGKVMVGGKTVVTLDFAAMLVEETA
ncbi:MAG: beta-hydroxyacyl-ACP dehydratase [Nitrospinae bacterium]|nr:beta-hydroxyacyl-ACP dehydratase [Nitrospinota bacterium]